MSEASRAGTEAPKDVKAVWERTRDLNKRLTALEGLNLGETVAELALVVKKLTDKPASPKSGVWNWSRMTPDQQATAWRYLVDWMENTFRVRYPRSYKAMLGYEEWPTSCWYKHKDMIESLTGLLTSYHWAYTDPESGPLRVAEWLDRWLPGAVRQGQFILRECTRGEHKDPLGSLTPGLEPELEEYIKYLEAGGQPV